ncbi:hypothetical protein CSOJ01_08051 [Colletotrichum sojae]|uniref:Uncharacterized protein n=1 Tax=Colletotrichum sojae TaxID=2175907 RepID=A0A8H6J6T4_9PEZI|nr:hypothetical protein CSOJ01_08051 [Colletotrichum sojae]
MLIWSFTRISSFQIALSRIPISVIVPIRIMSPILMSTNARKGEVFRVNRRATVICNEHTTCSWGGNLPRTRSPASPKGNSANLATVVYRESGAGLTMFSNALRRHEPRTGS